MKKSQHFGYYDKNHTTEPSAQSKYHKEFTKLLNLKPGMQVLDAGCGQGVVASYLAKHHKVTVTGITITPYEVNSAKKLARKLGVSEDTTFLLADYADPPFEPSLFDRIYTTETLSHAPDVQKVLDEFKKLLKPGGLLVCTEYMMDHEKFDDEMREDMEFMRVNAAIYGMYQFGRGEFLQKLKNTGFSNVTETDWTKHVKPSFDRVRTLARPLSRIVSRDPLRRHFINSTAARLYADGVEKGVFEYKAYTAGKPLK